jgi:phage FluMu protein gp41
MRRNTAEMCTSNQDVNVFGVTVGDGQHLQISLAEVKAKSTFDALYATFQEVAPNDAKAWLEDNGAVLVTDEPITQMITAVSAS